MLLKELLELASISVCPPYRSRTVAGWQACNRNPANQCVLHFSIQKALFKKDVPLLPFADSGGDLDRLGLLAGFDHACVQGSHSGFVVFFVDDELDVDLPHGLVHGQDIYACIS